MSKSDAFGEIGMAYAERYADLDAARTSFLQDRDALLAELRTQLDHSLRAAAVGGELSTPKNGDGAVWATMTGSAYTAARTARKRKGAAGVQFELRPLDRFKLPDRFGFVASAWFTMGQPQLNRLRSEGDPLGGKPAFLSGSVVFVTQRIVVAGEADATFDKATMFGAVAPTIELFRELDVALATAVSREVGAAADDDAG